MKLENVLRRIHANSANLFHGRPPLFEICNDLILARLMPSGAVHTNRMALMVRQEKLMRSSQWKTGTGKAVAGRPVASVAWSSVTATAKRTQRFAGV